MLDKKRVIETSCTHTLLGTHKVHGKLIHNHHLGNMCKKKQEAANKDARRVVLSGYSISM
jgi:hypothetical protein